MDKQKLSHTEKIKDGKDSHKKKEMMHEKKHEHHEKSMHKKHK